MIKVFFFFLIFKYLLSIQKTILKDIERISRECSMNGFEIVIKL